MHFAKRVTTQNSTEKGSNFITISPGCHLAHELFLRYGTFRKLVSCGFYQRADRPFVTSDLVLSGPFYSVSSGFNPNDFLFSFRSAKSFSSVGLPASFNRYSAQTLYAFSASVCTALNLVGAYTHPSPTFS